MKKHLLALSCALAGAVACAASLSVSFEKWDANPLAWSFRDNAVSCRSGGGLAVYEAAPRAAKVKVSAMVTPASAGTNGWATLGVALVDDERNYWHLALVQAPPDDKWNPGGHFFELCESRDGSWLAQITDKLKQERFEQHGSWSYGQTYAFTLFTDGAGIQGEVRDAAGKLLFVRRFAFPVSAPGGSRFCATAVTCGRPALHANGGFCGRFTALDATSEEPRPCTKAAKSFPPYASDSFAPEVKEDATGFFRVVQRPDGRWWAIDPLGRGVVLMGVDHVTYRGHWSQRTKRSVHHEVNKKKFPNKADWEADTLARLKAWGFNLLGAGCDPALERRGLVHTRFLSMGDSLCWNESDDAFWICPNEHRPCSAFPNVFDPLFPAHCDYMARKKCAPNKDDPWLFGYFIDNELAWWGRGASATGLFDAVMKKAETHSAKIALRAFLKERGVKGEPSAEVKLDFLRLAAERYFGICAAAIRRHDPNHLVMGARFAGLGGAHDAVWEIAGKYCDLVTFNIYPWADIDRNVVFVHQGAKANRVADAFEERYAIVKRPMLITEWSFPALDSGLPCTAGAGQRFRTQKERTAATELFAKTMLATPSMLGYDYFMWVDEPAEGISDAFPEDSNYGLINLNGDAYPEITSMFTRLHKDIGKWRAAAVPSARKATPATGTAAAQAIAKLGAAKDAVCLRDGDRYVVKSAGLALEGRVGGGDVFDKVIVNGKNLGRFTLMLCDNTGGSLNWQNVGKVTGAEWLDGALFVVAEGGARGARFTLTCAVTPVAGKPWFVCDLVKAVNLGPGTIDVHAFYFRQYVDYFHDKDVGSEQKKVPNLWKATEADAWFRKDGAYLGGVTFAPTVSLFRYFTSNEGKSQHPDAMFSPPAKLILAPGASYEPKGQTWFISVGGTAGGRAAWQADVKRLETAQW
ncbi:MAG: hypothetical protein IJI36_00670 [Kiritimatiellae bacterium]|nr:hypothetical protein [Kiritimatiellia bacterium]